MKGGEGCTLDGYSRCADVALGIRKECSCCKWVIAGLSLTSLSKPAELPSCNNLLLRTKMNKLLLTLTAFARVVMPIIGVEPIGPVLANPTTSDQDALILRILKAVQ